MRSGIATIFAFFLSISLLFSAPPANDNLANRVTLTNGVPATGTLADATIEQGEFSFAVGFPKRSVWYEISVPAGMKARITVTPEFATMDPIVFAADGTDFASYVIRFQGDCVGAGNSDRLAFANTSADTETYLINVGNQTAEVGAFQILLTLDTDGPPNDLFSNSTILTGAGTFVGTTLGATVEKAQNTAADANPPFASTWHTLVIPGGVQATITVAPTGFNARVSTYQGDEFAALTVGPSVNNAGYNGAEKVVLTNRDVIVANYYIAVDGINQGSGAYSLHVALAPAPPLNDDLIAAEPLFDTVVGGTNAGATLQPGEPAHAGSAASKSVWYFFSLAPGNKATVTVTPGNFDARIAVYTYGYNDFAALTLIAFANNGGPGFAETATTPANIFSNPHRFVVAVDGFAGSSGYFNIEVQTFPAEFDHDNFANAAQIPMNTFESVAVNTAGASSEAGEPILNGQPARSLWHRFTSPVSGRLTITLQGTGGTTPSYAVFTGNSINTLTTVLDYGSTEEFAVTQGQDYFIAVSTPSGQEGTATLQFSFWEFHPGRFFFGRSTYFFSEGDGHVALTVYRDGTDGAVSLPYTITPETASDADFMGTSGTLEFAEGVSIMRIFVFIVDDSYPELGESFTITLGTPSTGTTTDPRATTGVILPDAKDQGGDYAFYVPSAGFTGLINSNFEQPGFGYLQFAIGRHEVASGKVFVDGAVLPFRATFVDGTNSSTMIANLVLRRGSQSSDLILTLTLLGDSYHFTGTLAGASPEPYLIDGERDSLGSRSSPVAHMGTFNALLAGHEVAGTGGEVRGYSRVSVKPTGAATLVGVLPDGTKFSARSQVSLLGHLYFSTPLYRRLQGKAVGYFTGSIDITSNEDPKQVLGSTRWNKPANNEKLYPEGVTRAALALTGTQYRAPLRNELVLPDFNAGNGAASITLFGGNLAADLVKSARFTTANVLLITNPADDKLKLKIAPATGLISGTFKHIDGKSRSITGIAVQSTPGVAEGLFAGATEAGVIRLEPTP